MSKKKKLIPEKRFPEFTSDGTWKKHTLGDITKLVSKRNTANKKLPIYSINNKEGFLPQDEQFEGINSSDRGYDISLYKVIERNTFAYNPARIDVGSIGFSGELSNIIISSLYVCFQAEKSIENRFLWHFFDTFQFNRSVKSNVEGGIRNYLFYENFSRINIAVPPTIKEQQKIASCLSSLDELIKAHIQKLDLLKDHKKGLTQNLFPQEGENIPKYRFPEFKKGEVWVEKSLEEVATILKGKGISKADIIENGDLPCIRYGELYTHYNETIRTVKSYTNSNADGLVLSKENDVIIPASGETQIDIATASCVLEDGIALGGDLNIIRSKINGVFLSYYLNNAKKYDIAQMAQGIAVVHLYPNQLKTLQLQVPSPKEQLRVASCLASLDEITTAQTEKIEKLKQHKKGLVQSLFPKMND